MNKLKFLLSFITLLITANPVHAQFKVAAPGNKGIGEDNFVGLPIKDLGQLLSILMQTALIIAGLGFFVYLLFGGVRWLSSGGDPKGTQSARDSITTALVGLIIIVSAYGVIRIVEAVFGLTILSGNIKFPTP